MTLEDVEEDFEEHLDVTVRILCGVGSGFEEAVSWLVVGAERSGSAVVDEESVGMVVREEVEGGVEACADVAEVDVVVEEPDGVQRWSNTSAKI